MPVITDETLRLLREELEQTRIRFTGTSAGISYSTGDNEVDAGDVTTQAPQETENEEEGDECVDLKGGTDRFEASDDVDTVDQHDPLEEDRVISFLDELHTEIISPPLSFNPVHHYH